MLYVVGRDGSQQTKNNRSKPYQQELLAYEYETGDEFEAERIREFADWFADIDRWVGDAFHFFFV